MHRGNPTAEVIGAEGQQIACVVQIVVGQPLLAKKALVCRVQGVWMVKVVVQQALGAQLIRKTFEQLGQVATNTLAQQANAIAALSKSRRSATFLSPSSQVICANASEPRSPVWSNGPVSRSGLYRTCGAACPRAQSRP